MKFDRKKFFDSYRLFFGSLKAGQVKGLEQLLGFIEADPYIKHIPEAAFLLGTTKHETAHTFQPIHEYGGRAYFVKRYGGQTRKGKELGNDTPDEGYYYAGKGYPQTTGESNYERAEEALRREYPALVADFEKRTGRKFDLTVGDQPNDTKDPQNMLDPAIAYATMSYGARTGMFTGAKLSRYVTATKKDYKGSRRVINGTDQDDEIAAYCVAFERILRASKVSAADGLSTRPSTERAKNTVQGDQDTTASQQPQIKQDAAVGEVTAKKETETPTGTETIEAKTLNEQSVHDPAKVNAPEPYMGVGFWGVIKRDLGAATGGNLTFQGVAEYAQQASGWPEWVVALLGKFAAVLAVATVCYFIFRIVHYLADSWKKNQKVKIEAEAATSTVRKDIKWQGWL